MPKTKSGRDGGSIAEVRRYHVHYLRAMNNPLRRRILRAIPAQGSTFEELQADTGLNPAALQWHLTFLEHACCVEREVKEGSTVYKLTQEGQVVDFLEADE